MSATTGFNPISTDDLEECLTCCADSFSQLAALLLAIKEKSPGCSDAARLAALGLSFACNMESCASDAARQMQKGGVAQ